MEKCSGRNNNIELLFVRNAAFPVPQTNKGKLHDIFNRILKDALHHFPKNKK